MAAQQEAQKPTAAPAAAADPKAAAAAGKAGDAPQPKRKRGKLLWIIGAVVVLGAAAGGAYPLLRGDTQATAAQEPAIFLPLETFTVNLLPNDAPQQYLQVSVTLKLATGAAGEAVKARMPEVRNRILLQLSSKRAADLLPIAGKQKLATEIAEGVRSLLDPPTKPPPPPDTAAAPASTETPAADAASDPAQAGGQATRPLIEVLFTGFIVQ